MLSRTGLVVVAALVSGLGATAAHADPPPGHSVIGDGGIVGDGDYIGSADPDADVDATAGTARTISRLYPSASRAKAHCASAASACVVVAVWTPEDRKNPPRQAQNPPSRLGAFDHWLDFTPELTTSPTHQDALIARLPTWVWDRNTADIRGICLPIFGGVCGFAVRLGTTWKTEDTTFCRNRGTVYRPGQVDPRSASDCSWTYRTSGPYGIEGCKNWLVVVWRLPWYIPIVFPLELCHTDQVNVQEAQILSGGGSR